MTVGTFEYTDFSDVDSSAIRTVYYNTESRELAVVFNGGGTSIYDDVPYEAFSGLIDSASAGSEYNRKVKGVYNSRYRTAIYGVKFEQVEPLERKSGENQYIVKGVFDFKSTIEANSVEEAIGKLRKLLAASGHDASSLVVKEVTIKFD